MKVWLTGGSGLLGRHLLAHPRAQTDDIVAPSSADLNLLDEAAVLAFALRERPDCVIHAAARSAGIQSRQAHPYAFLADNILISAHVVSAARRAGVRRLINLGSAAMYPALPATQLLSPDMLLTGPFNRGNESYGLAKLVASRLVAAAGAEGGLTYRTVVPCNMYGPFDDFRPEHSQLIPSIIRKVAAALRDGDDEIEVWGDGTVRRELLYAGDMAAFIWTWLDRLGELPPVMNVGSGFTASVLDCYRLVAQLAGYTGTYRFDLSKPAGSAGAELDLSSQRQLGWHAPTRLQSGLVATLAYYEELGGS